MDLIFTFSGILGFVIHFLIFLHFAKVSPLGAISLPCAAVLTSFLYFYFMPVVLVMTGRNYLLGMELTSLEDTHWVTLLYVLGMATACGLNQRKLHVISLNADEIDMPLNRVVFFGLWALSLSSILALFLFGQLSLAGDIEYKLLTTDTPIAFLNLGLSLAEPITLIYLIRDNFGFKSLGVLTGVLYVFSVAGFRYRVLILLCAVGIAFLIVRRIRVRISMVIAGAITGVYLMNLMGMARRYGTGFQSVDLGSLSMTEILTGFGGESGIVYVTQYAASNPPEWIWFEPYIISVVRLVPSFIWPDKPTASYLTLWSSYFFDQNAARGFGLAAPQQVEMLYQFGQAGVFVLAFIYFTLINRLQYAMARVSHDARIAGLSLIPPFFGYFMQSRGYFYQIFLDAVFTFAPVFLVHIGMTRRHGSSVRGVRRAWTTRQ
jgi:hypothetical protein